MPVKLKLMHLIKFGKISRENKNFPVKTIKFVLLKMNFLPVKKKKTKKRKNLLVKKKGCEKGRKWAKKRA